MKNIVKILAVAAAIFAFASCETYKVAEPDMTAVYKVDGDYVCFAYADGATEPSALFHVSITNTTNNDPDRIWITVADYNRSCDWFKYVYGAAARNGLAYPSAARFQASYDAKANSFKATNVQAEIPRTVYSPLQEQHYYSLEYNFTDETYVVSIDGNVTVDGVNTKTGYKTDGISFTYSRTDEDGNTDNFYVVGMKNTGWGEDLIEYGDYIDEMFY